VAEVEAPCSAERLFEEVDDLVRYPAWLTIVPRAVAADDGTEAWTVDLRGRLGPMARSKRLRMIRSAHEKPHHCRFEREERDGRDHSAWVLDAAVEETGAGTSKLTMRLHYGGSFGGSLLERMLRDEIERSRPALLALLAAPAR